MYELIYKCIFSSVTNRGTGFNREPGEGEYAVDIEPSKCGWFASYPSRYQYTNNELSEFPGWEAEEAQAQLLLNQDKMAAEIVAEEDRRSYLPLVHEGHTYKVSSAIQDTKLIILGSELTDPLPLNGGCWDDVEGNPVPMTVGEFFVLAQAAYTRGAINYSVRKAHIVAMKELEDPTIYDYSGGWT